MNAVDKCRAVIEEKKAQSALEKSKAAYMERRFEQLRFRIDEMKTLTEQRALAQIETEWEIYARSEAEINRRRELFFSKQRES